MYRLVRPLLFRLDPETAHGLTLALLRRAGRNSLLSNLLRAVWAVRDPRLEVSTFGLRFANPIGLAAGYDKNGRAVAGLAALGFGHVEVGTVTRQPQMGNPRPRIRRAPSSDALINWMGFPNQGIDSLIADSRTWPRQPLRVGINLGKGTATPLERAAEEYSDLVRRAHGHADYLAINVSSPNTQGLRQLQSRAWAADLLKAVAATRDDLQPRVPLLVKIAPDLSPAEIDDLLAAIDAAGVDGVIATNTTVSRDGLPDEARGLAGGLSGAPLGARSTEVIRTIAHRTGGRLPIIGVGGVDSVEAALEKLRAGATLIQLYTGLIYRGPGLAAAINRGLLRACQRTGAQNIGELALA